MPQEHDTGKPSPDKPKLRLRRSAETDDPAKPSERPAVESPPPEADAPAPPKSPPPQPPKKLKAERTPKEAPPPTGAPGTLMQEALRKEQQLASKTTDRSHENPPKASLIIAKAVILLILFGGGLSLVLHSVLNLGKDEAQPEPGRTATVQQADPTPATSPQQTATRSTITIISEDDVLPGIDLDAEVPPPAAEPTPVPALIEKDPPPKTADPTPTVAQDPAVKRWLDQVAISSPLGNRMILNQKLYNLGDTVDGELGIRWTHVDHQTKTLTFTDKNSVEYRLRY